jgi:flagellar protein FliJ
VPDGNESFNVMKRFSFNLEAVLSHRKLLEELEEQKLNKISCSIHDLETLLARMRREAEECRKTLHKPTPGEIDVDEMQQMVAYLQKLEKEIYQILIHLARLNEDKRVQSEKLVEARKKREILDKLKEKSFANFQYELKGMEQKLLDELVTERYGLQDEQNLPGPDKNS